MNFYLFFTILLSSIFYCFCPPPPPVIKNTRAEGCFDGTCGSHCAYDGAKLFPSDNLNQIGKCRMLSCNNKFDVKVTGCFPNISGRHTVADADINKPYPECCGRIIQTMKW